MKYIRTADGRIIDTEKEYQPLQWAEQARDYALTIAEADTIEELCDEFVVYHKYEDNDEYYGLCTREYEWKHAIKGDVIYGAIWTDKGLIYIAKMNEDGEFELI